MISPAKIQYVLVGDIDPGKIRAKDAIVLMDIITREQNDGRQRRLLNPRTKPPNIGFIETWIARTHVNADATRHHLNKWLLPPDTFHPAT